MEFQLSTYSWLQLKADNPTGHVTLCDSTLRDGEQAGVKYTLEEKMHLIRMMDEACIPEIQMYSLRNERSIAEAEAVCAIKRSFSKIEVMSRATNPNWRKEIEGIAHIGADITHTLIPLSSYVRGAYGPALDDDALMQRIVDVVTLANQLGSKAFNLSLLDTTRTPEMLLERAVKTGADAGADRICLADTVGCLSPKMMFSLVQRVRSWIPRTVKLRVHVHNDFGLATANALAAAEAGADMIDTCINGMGKRAGNADMVQVMMGLKAFYGLETGIREDKVYALCREVEALSGVPIPTNTPFTGELVFADDSEYHIKGNEVNPFAFQAIDPEGWGNPRRILVGKNSGHYGMCAKLKQLGLDLPDEKSIEQLYHACLERSSALGRGKYLTDGMIKEIYETICGR